MDKFCKRCGEQIAGAESDYHFTNAVQYCPACAKEMKRINNAKYMRNRRAKKSAENRELREQISLLKELTNGYKQELRELRARLNGGLV